MDLFEDTGSAGSATHTLSVPFSWMVAFLFSWGEGKAFRGESFHRTQHHIKQLHACLLR